MREAPPIRRCARASPAYRIQSRAPPAHTGASRITLGFGCNFSLSLSAYARCNANVMHHARSAMFAGAGAVLTATAAVLRALQRNYATPDNPWRPSPTPGMYIRSSYSGTETRSFSPNPLGPVAP